MKRLIDVNPMSGTKTFHEYDHLTKVTTISTESDVSPILEINKRQYNDTDLKTKGIKKGMWKVASIPNDVIEKWMIEDGINVFDKNHQPAVMRKLQDRDYLYLRTSPGNIT